MCTEIKYILATTATIVMKACLLWLIFIFTIAGLPAQDLPLPVKDFGTNPGRLSMYLYVPKDLNKNKKIPLVLVLHGCSQNVLTISMESGWNKLADSLEFIVLYPGQKLLNNPYNCFNWFMGKDNSRNSGEALSIKEMLDYTMQHYTIDSSRVFTYGVSAGAAMSVALLADYPEIFKAGASLAGGAYPGSLGLADALSNMLSPPDKTGAEWAAVVKEQNPNYRGHYPEVIILQGEDDELVKPANAIQLVRQWTYLHHTSEQACNTTASFAGNADVTKYIYCDTTGNTAVVYYQIKNLGHALPVWPGNGIERGGKTGLYTVDKNFHSTYWIAVDFGLIPKEGKKEW
ncbi:MAG TPA: PHB depolymerase family esterase [Chitinophagales bacterium]|nr:PHB depolymerase family esterase [Chitinophagales bacterium]